jgi:hypothetical protein
MKEGMGSLGRVTLAKACTSFRSRIEALFTADGSFIEYVDCQCVSLLIFFYFNKIGWFSALLCHLKERRKNSGFIAATLYNMYAADYLIPYPTEKLADMTQWQLLIRSPSRM